jgi:hypothetical protein
VDQPRPQDAERSCMFDGSTDAWLVQHSRLSTDKGWRHLLFLEKEKR